MSNLRIRLWLLLVGLTVPRPASANIFYAPLLPGPETEQFGRFHFGTYATNWQFSDKVVEEFPSDVVRQTANPGILAVGDYALTRRLSIGGWYNSFTGAVKLRQAIPHSTLLAGRTAFDYSADYWDAHVNYNFSDRDLRALGPHLGKNWSFQFGYSGLEYHLRRRPPFKIMGRTKAQFDLASPNFWLTRSGELARIGSGGGTHRVNAFGSLGYHTSSDFNQAVNFIAGVSVDLTPHLSFNTDFWLHDFNDPKTRITAGLVGRF